MSERAWATSVVSGTVAHARTGTVQRRFTHPYRSFLVDLAELPRLERSAWPWFGVDRRRPVTLRTSDHLTTEQGGTISVRVDACLARHGIEPPAAGRTLGLVTLRGFGTGFDPVTVWFRYDDLARLVGVVVDVHNTYGESHPYVSTDIDDDGWVRTRFDKRFHVSPFLGLDGAYDIAVRPPAATPGPGIEHVVLRVEFRSGDGADHLLAVQQGRREPLDGRRLRRLVVEHRFQGLRSTLLIRWHALQLWRAGARFRRKPPFTPGVGSSSTDSTSTTTTSSINEPTGAPR